MQLRHDFPQVRLDLRQQLFPPRRFHVLLGHSRQEFVGQILPSRFGVRRRVVQRGQPHFLDFFLMLLENIIQESVVLLPEHAPEPFMPHHLVEQPFLDVAGARLVRDDIHLAVMPYSVRAVLVDAAPLLVRFHGVRQLVECGNGMD